MFTFSSVPSLLFSPPTWAHVMPRHGYTLSNASFTPTKSGYVPASYRPNFSWLLIVCAADGLHHDTSGSTAAEKVAPSAAFFCDRPSLYPILYLRHTQLQ